MQHWWYILPVALELRYAPNSPAIRLLGTCKFGFRRPKFDENSGVNRLVNEAFREIFWDAWSQNRHCPTACIRENLLFTLNPELY